MSTTVATVDESAASPAPGRLENFVDVNSLEAQQAKAAARNRAETQPYRQYMANVIQAAKVNDSLLTRQLASSICGAVARLPFLPDSREKIEGTKTEYDLQVERLAGQAESTLGSDVVMTVAARKLAKAALDLRKQDPEGKKGKAWVNVDPATLVRGGTVPSALTGEEVTED